MACFAGDRVVRARMSIRHGSFTNPAESSAGVRHALPLLGQACPDEFSVRHGFRMFPKLMITCCFSMIYGTK
jgi:hypothetical protein